MFIHYKKFTICFGCLAACGGPCPAGRRPGPGMVSHKGRRNRVRGGFRSYFFFTENAQGARRKEQAATYRRRSPSRADPRHEKAGWPALMAGIVPRAGQRAGRVFAPCRSLFLSLTIPMLLFPAVPRKSAGQRFFAAGVFPAQETPRKPGSGAGCIPPAPSRQTACGPVPAVPRKKSRTACAVLLPVSFFAGLHAACFFRFFRCGWIASRSARTSAVARLTRSAASHRLGSRKATRISPE